MTVKTNVIYLIGLSGTGKYTIAKELAKSGYRIADNQLMNNPIFELLGYDGFGTIPDKAWHAIGKIRKCMLDFISEDKDNNYVLTNELLEDEGDRNCYAQVKKASQKRHSLFAPVKLHISREENARRIANPDRAARYKSLSLDENSTRPLINIVDPNLLELDVTNLSAVEAANIIMEFAKSRDTTSSRVTPQQRSDPLKTIQKLVNERYKDAKCIFWAGSVSKNQGTDASDLDIVIVYENLPNAYREAFIYDNWPIDAFVHDLESLRYFLEESRVGAGISSTIYMIMHGVEITNPNDFSAKVKALAHEIFQAGPALWDKDKIDMERFLTTDILEDIKFPASREEQIASAASLYEPLAQFYFRSMGRWCSSVKSVVRYLQDEDLALAREFTSSFGDLFQSGNTERLEILVEKLLAPYGGLFWDGFRSDAPKDYKLED